MRYLFFDIENANCKDNFCKMYSFGYLLADENLNIIVDHTDMLMNPEVDVWDWYVVKNMMAYSKKEIEGNPNFVKRYEKIKKLIEGEDTIAVGFSTLDDIGYLMDSCKRYNLEPFKIKFFDIQKVCAKLSNRKRVSLKEEFITWCKKIAEDNHRSDYDALYTYEITKSVCKKSGKTLKELIYSESYSVGHTDKFAYGYDNEEIITKDERKARSEQKRIERYNMLLERAKRNGGTFRELKDAEKDFILKGSKNSVMFIRYLENVKINDNENCVFSNKKISISLNYEMYNFRNMIKLIKLIADNGGEYIKKASLADYFVPFETNDNDGNEIPDNKLKYVKEAIDEGKEIKIISFEELLKLLHITEEELNSMPEIDLTYLEEEKYRKNKTKN